ncbi:MAG: hypothetical protein A2X61_10080 [Ignavibacteria bacterium GWB2_35_12]|nr:MAG: hypothetical protein A2X63_06360 [Ignavibacteria bacterium GWA2_35_8]OGU39697.1 MAG: hypothetical protein A2X61_10080 [Ignavibacteria bacterium GWB2_35_12]OGU89544.1 MAG: hypothetical protein A2220_01950 [Ignavibacteria bacterium RIFOXYA2_FULL_35_10]OGV23892.1 MAG: hypothetical protein A2475_07270 [Ignavibacteria bacterium RIFOXYC2_FULL_35_21]
MPVTQQQIDKAVEIAKEYGATKVLLFGSALEDPENANDLDIGVLGIPDDKFFQFGGVLENIIIKNVDVVPLNNKSLFIEYIKKHGKYIYES